MIYIFYLVSTRREPDVFLLIKADCKNLHKLITANISENIQ
jgi:hypothetical protein